jgi:FlaA1/EpsC-like NDP-sugar epimerase
MARECKVEIKLLPKLEEQLKGVDRLPIREVSYNDLLRRDPAEMELGAIEEIIAGKSVMVTGAGGSIGSELCRQLVKFNPCELILLGRGENRIYEIERELRELNLGVTFSPKIVNITDKPRMKQVFEYHCPSVIFHAAAHKHVPLVEQNVGESIINNVVGTKNIADLAHHYKVDRFVMVSTDKAVNPTSVMGCTKHMAERYCQALDSHSGTKFISTRFGNVLGSAGSVVPLFQKQIQAGGPITVTDRRMTRYFMTIPEASQLVIQAATMGSGGEIFVLEMGEPVKILDLANDLIRLAGHQQGSIDIVESGIRPGEKLFEELYYKNEKSIPTSHEKILSSLSRKYSLEEVELQINTLIEVAYSTPAAVKMTLKELIPEFAYSPVPRPISKIPLLDIANHTRQTNTS